MPASRLGYAGLLLVLLLHLALATAYFVVLPPLEGNDSIAHMNYVNYLREERRLPRLDSKTVEYSYELVQQPPLYYAAAALASAPLSFDDADEQTRRSENPYFGVLSPRWSISLPDATASFYLSVRLARLLSVLGGLITVAATWLWVAAALPHEAPLATAVAALVGFNPLFLFLAASVSNDSWAVAGITVTIWLTTVAARQESVRPRHWLAIGMVMGLAALTKYSVLLVSLPVAVILLSQPRWRAWRPLLQTLLLLAAGSLLTGGFWYLRNLWLYGELVPLQALTTALPTFLRTTPLSLQELVGELPWLLQSYWGQFVTVLAPPDYYRFWRIFMVIGSFGVGASILRTGRQTRWDLLLVCAVWIGAVLISGGNWMRLVSFGVQARLIYIAAPAIALLLMLGWRGWFPSRWQNGVTLAMVPVLTVVALWPLPTLIDRFALPTPLPEATEPDRPVYARFAGGPTLRGFDLPDGAAVAVDAALPLTLYFETDELIEQDYTLFIHVSDADDNLLYQWDGVPFDGRHPTRQWRTFQLFADPHELALEDARPGQLLTLSIGFYLREEPERRLTVYGPDDQPIGDRLTLAELRILDGEPAQAKLEATPLATWEPAITLLAADVTQTDGEVLVDTAWQTDELLPANYTIFLQLLDGDGEVVAQVDEQPQSGRAPTATWLPHEVITDTIHLPAPAEPWQSMIVGWYDARTGERLQLAGGAFDYFTLRSSDGAE